MLVAIDNDLVSAFFDVLGCFYMIFALFAADGMDSPFSKRARNAPLLASSV